MLLVENLGEVLDDSVVKIFSSEMGITGCGQNFEDTFLDGQERNIKGTTTQIVDDNTSLVTLLIQSISDSSGRRLVDDSEDSESGNGTGILCCLSLSVVEVSRNSDDGVSYSLAKVGLSDLLHLGEDHRGNFFWCEGLFLALDGNLDDRAAILVDEIEWKALEVLLNVLVVPLSTDESFRVVDGVLRVRWSLVLGTVTDKSFIIGKGYPGGRYPVSLVIDENLESMGQ